MLKHLCISVLSLYLIACSTTPSVKQKDHWAISGKIGITTPTESVAGFIQWKQVGNDFDIYVSGPLSVGSTRIQGNVASISLTQKGKTIKGLNPQQLIYDELGWVFPIENLPFWLQGKVAPYSPASKKVNDDQQITQIRQNKWQVDFLRYNDYYQQPERIRISQGGWKFLIVIKHWDLG